MPIRLPLFILICLLFNFMISAPSFAMERPFPQNTKFGIFTPSAIPKIVIDEKIRQLSAGAQIRNQQNLIVQPMSLTGADVKILYKENNHGRIERIWMLSPDEVKKYSPDKLPMATIPTRVATPATGNNK